MLQPPSLSWMLLTVCGECAPRTIRIGYTCRNVTRPRRSTTGGSARWSPRCTYLQMLALDGNTLAGGSLTFLWLSARPRVPRIWPGPLPGPLWIRLAGEEGEAGGRVRASRCPVSCCRWVAGYEKRGPRPGGCRRKSWGFRACLTPPVAKAGLHFSGHLLHVSSRLTSSSRFVGPSGVAGLCCAAACHWVVAVRPVARRGSGSWGGVPCVAPGRRGGY